MKDILNARIKHREMFRPFAPSVLAEATGEYFENSYPSPFMTLAYSVRPEKRASHSRADACGWHGPAADCHACGEPALLAADSRVRQSYGRAGSAEHLV